MRFKPLLHAFAAAVVLAASGVIASAQVTQIGGKVTLKQADGTVVPVAGAQIDIYRTDIKWEDHIKTNKKGEYQHAGIPFVGTYTVVVSAPGARPDYIKDVRLSQLPTHDFQLLPGDGSRLTLDQIKTMEAAGGGKPSGGGAPVASKEDKAKAEEMQRQVAEVTKKNEAITKGNEIVGRTFKAGNDALSASPPRYDEAIAQYREGLAARPDETALLTNLSEALRRRGVDRFNAAIKMSDNDAKTQGMDAAKKDWAEAAETATKAVGIVKAAPSTGDNANQATNDQNKKAAFTTRALALRLVATKVDQTKAADAFAAYQEMMGIETDPAKKAKDKGDALQMLYDAGATDLAIAEAQKALAENPDDVDANRIMGLALFASGDKTKFQQAANYLQHYVDKAPDTDPLKASAKESLDYLKTAENIKPEKTQPTRGGGRKHP
jgi:tetratricopeptide (TPR) repeat protein